jgi:hypothetical protein
VRAECNLVLETEMPDGCCDCFPCLNFSSFSRKAGRRSGDEGIKIGWRGALAKITPWRSFLLQSCQRQKMRMRTRCNLESGVVQV